MKVCSLQVGCNLLFYILLGLLHLSVRGEKANVCVSDDDCDLYPY